MTGPGQRLYYSLWLHQELLSSVLLAALDHRTCPPLPCLSKLCNGKWLSLMGSCLLAIAFLIRSIRCWKYPSLVPRSNKRPCQIFQLLGNHILWHFRTSGDSHRVGRVRIRGDASDFPNQQECFILCFVDIYGGEFILHNALPPRVI